MTIAEVITVITALTTLVTAIGVAVVAVRQAGMKKTVVDTQVVAKQTEKLVNSRMDSMMRLLQDYRGAMQRSGIDIPSDSSLSTRDGRDAIQ
jgi:hypothetical protein